MTLFQRWASSSVSSTALSRPPTGITGPFLPRRHSIRRCPTGSLSRAAGPSSTAGSPRLPPTPGSFPASGMPTTFSSQTPRELLSGAGGAPLLLLLLWTAHPLPRPRDRNRRSGWRPGQPGLFPAKGSMRRQRPPGQLSASPAQSPGVFPPGPSETRQPLGPAGGIGPPGTACRRLRKLGQQFRAPSPFPAPGHPRFLHFCRAAHPLFLPPDRSRPQLPPPGPPPPMGRRPRRLPILPGGSRCPPLPPP